MDAPHRAAVVVHTPMGRNGKTRFTMYWLGRSSGHFRAQEFHAVLAAYERRNPLLRVVPDEHEAARYIGAGPS